MCGYNEPVRIEEIPAPAVPVKLADINENLASRARGDVVRRLVIVYD